MSRLPGHKKAGAGSSLSPPRELPRSPQLGPILEMAPNGSSRAQAQDRVRVAHGLERWSPGSQSRPRPAPRASPHRKAETTARFPSLTARKRRMVPGTEIGLRPLLSTFTTQCGSNIEGEQEVCIGGGRGRKPYSRRSPPSSGPRGTEGKGDQAGWGHVPDRHQTEGKNEAKVSNSGQVQAAETSDQLDFGFWSSCLGPKKAVLAQIVGASFPGACMVLLGLAQGFSLPWTIGQGEHRDRKRDQMF